MSDVAHHTTKKGATDNKAKKRPTAKPQRAETKPAPHGQRITPVIDPALVKKVNEEILKRSKEEKTVEDKKTIIEYLVKEGVTAEEITGIMQMRFREKKKVAGVTEKKSSESKEENKLNGATEENSDVSLVIDDGHDNSGLVKEEITPKRNAQRTAKEKVTKYAGDNEDEDDESIIHGMDMDEDDIASDYMGSDSETEKKIKKVTTKPKQPRKPKAASSDAASPAKKKSPATKNGLDIPMENQENGNETSPKSKTEKPKKPPVKKEPKKETVKKEPKKSAKRPKPADSDDDDFPILSNPSTPTKKPRTQRGAAAKKSYHFSDEDDDDEDYV